MMYQIRKHIECLKKHYRNVVIPSQNIFSIFLVMHSFDTKRAGMTVFLEELLLAISLMSTLLYSSKSIAASSETDTVFSEAVSRRVASTYYAVQEDIIAQRKKAYAGRDVSTSFPPSNQVTGWVVNRKGLPVSGAYVSVVTKEGKTLIGEGRTDEDGCFEIDLPTDAHQRKIVKVWADGYDQYIVTTESNIVEHPILLYRSLDTVFMTELLAEKNPEERLWMLLEIVGARWPPLSFSILYDVENLEIFFPYLGHLREGLLVFTEFPLFSQPDDGYKSPANRAVEILGYWCHEDDEVLLREKLADTYNTTFPQSISGQTLEVTLEKWGQWYFEKKDAEKFCSHPIYSTDETRAIFSCCSSAECLKVLFVKHENQWELKRMFDRWYVEVWPVD